MRARYAVSALLIAALWVMLAPATGEAASAGKVFAFGENFYGQLGNATNNDTTSANPTPTVVSLPGEIGQATVVSSDDSSSLVATSGGQLYAFGNNEYGQLGNATNNGTSDANPTPALITLPGQIGVVTQAAAGDDHSLVLTSGDQLYAFGNNYDGPLGNSADNGANVAHPTPMLVTLPNQDGAITQIAAGYEDSFAATSSGQLYAFGDNRYGELGNATNNNSDAANPTPTLVDLPRQSGTVTQIDAGYYHSLVVTSSGQLYAFGDNDYGQLGNATNNNSDAANATPTLVNLPGEVGGVTQAAAGYHHSLALTSSGQLYAFGWNASGQLGIDPDSDAHPTPMLVTLAGKSGSVTQIAAGYGDSLAVTSSGQLYSFGDDTFGDLGRPPGSMVQYTPELVPFADGSTIDTVAKGSFSLHTLAIVSDLSVSTSSLPGGTAGQSYSAPISASGGTAPLSFLATGLPTGLTIAADSGAISGIPTTSGSFSITLTVTDADGSQSNTTLSLTITSPPATATPTITDAGTSTNIPSVSTTPSVGQLLHVKITPVRASIAGRDVRGRCVAPTSRTSHHASCRRAVSLRLTYTMTVATTITLVLAQEQPGHIVRQRCVGVTPGPRRYAKCTIFKTLSGRLIEPVKAGYGSLRITRNFANRLLPAGTYRLMVTPEVGAARSVLFTISG